jgi:hypothetical protein
MFEYTWIFDFGQLGAVGVMLGMVWKLMIRKDKKSYEMIDVHNKERARMYKSMQELVVEVTAALVNKNNTDDKMSVAATKLADELRALREVMKNEDDHEAS